MSRLRHVCAAALLLTTSVATCLAQTERSAAADSRPSSETLGFVRRSLADWQRYPVLRPLLLIAKNLLGFVLIVAGIAMLVLPGQGLLTIVVGVVLMNFPGRTLYAARGSLPR